MTQLTLRKCWVKPVLDSLLAKAQSESPMTCECTSASARVHACVHFLILDKGQAASLLTCHISFLRFGGCWSFSLAFSYS